MALALIRSKGRFKDQFRFDLDIGSNRFYSYAIGEGKRRGPTGSALIAAPKHQGKLTESARLSPVRTLQEFEVPAKLFDRKNNLIQVFSFRTPDRKGPAISNIIKVPVGFSAEEALELPIPYGLSKSTTMYPHTTVNAPFPKKEANYSSAMFLGSLIGMLPQILPAVGGILGGLFKGGGKSGGGGGSSVGSNLAGVLQDPKMIETLMGLIQKISGTPIASASSYANNGFW